jgi:hypothetical protein
MWKNRRERSISMPKGWEKPVWSLLVVLLALVGCGRKASQPPPTPTETLGGNFPTGKFVNGSFSWEFKVGGSFISSGPPGSETGTYFVNGNQVAITCQCCGDITGTYTWSYENKVLVFKAVEDQCSNRLGVVGTGQWLQEPKP